MSFSRSTRSNILTTNLLLSSGNTYIGLSTTIPDDTGSTITNFTEPTEPRYERFLLKGNASVSNYSSTTDPDTQETIPGGVELANIHTLHIGPLANGYQFKYFGIFSAITGGSPIYIAPLTDDNGDPTTVTVNANTAFVMEKAIIAENKVASLKIMMPDG